MANKKGTVTGVAIAGLCVLALLWWGTLRRAVLRVVYDQALFNAACHDDLPMVKHYVGMGLNPFQDDAEFDEISNAYKCAKRNKAKSVVRYLDTLPGAPKTGGP